MDTGGVQEAQQKGRRLTRSVLRAGKQSTGRGTHVQNAGKRKNWRGGRSSKRMLTGSKKGEEKGRPPRKQEKDNSGEKEKNKRTKVPEYPAGKQNPPQATDCENSRAHDDYKGKRVRKDVCQVKLSGEMVVRRKRRKREKCCLTIITTRKV